MLLSTDAKKRKRETGIFLMLRNGRSREDREKLTFIHIWILMLKTRFGLLHIIVLCLI